MKEAFAECISLSSLPEISKWELCNIKKGYSIHSDDIFKDCINLMKLEPKYIKNNNSTSYPKEKDLKNN